MSRPPSIGALSLKDAAQRARLAGKLDDALASAAGEADYRRLDTLLHLAIAELAGIPLGALAATRRGPAGGAGEVVGGACVVGLVETRARFEQDHHTVLVALVEHLGDGSPGAVAGDGGLLCGSGRLSALA